MSDTNNVKQRTTVRGGYGARQRARTQKRGFVPYLIAGCLLVALAVVLSLRLFGHSEKPDEPVPVGQPPQDEEETFVSGVSVGGIALGGYTYEEADAMLRSDLQAVSSNQIELKYAEHSWVFTLGDVGLTDNLSDQLAAAWAYGHTGDAAAREQDITRLSTERVDLPLTYSYDATILANLVGDIKREIDCQPINATMSIVEVGKFSYTDSSDGVTLDAQALISDLDRLIRTGRGGTMQLTPVITPPDVTRESLEESTVLLGECITSLEGSTQARAANVNLALSSFNFLTVGPGRTVSFNRVVGERTVENGFQEATEYAGTNVAKGIGGGVCQASTTIYGAVIRAGLKVLERYNHTMTVSYVPASQDAAVSNTDKDLRFENNTNSVLYFFAWVDENTNNAICRIYGTPQDPTVVISIDSTILQADIPSTAITYREDEEGDTVYYEDEPPVLYKKGKPGLRSQAVRIYTDARTGAEISRETLSIDTYEPENTIYLIGVHRR